MAFDLHAPRFSKRHARMVKPIIRAICRLCTQEARADQRGFALLSTMLLLVLVALLSFGLLSLSAVSLRGSVQQEALLMARANARLGLQMALGELQKHAGPDQRITANAATMLKVPTSSASPVLGVWRSWEGKDANGGVPATPDYAAKAVAGSLQNPAANGRFLRWLVSSQGVTPDPASPPSLVPSAGSVALLDRGTLGASATDADRVALMPTSVFSSQNRQGGMAWWISGDNQKARLGIKNIAASSPVELTMKRASHAVADDQAFGLDVPEECCGRLLTNRSLDLAVQQPGISGTKWHHLTTRADGLLTDSANGGWKRDLSLLCERSGASANAPANDTILYPWAKLRDKTQSPWLDTAAVSSWGSVIDFATQYRSISSTTSQGIPVFGMLAAAGANGNYVSNRLPVIGAMRFVLAYSAVPSTTTLGSYEAAFTMNPVVTVWNPWNYAIDVNELAVQLHNLPLGFTWKVGTRELAAGFNDILGFAFNAQPILLRMRGPTGGTVFRLAPGDTRVFSPASATFVDVGSGGLGAIELRPGYRTRGGFRFRIPDLASTSATKPMLLGQPGAKFQVSIDPTKLNSREFGTDLTGVYFDVRAKINGGTMGTETHRMDSLPATAKKYFSPMSYGEFPSTTLQTAAASNQVFASFQIGRRTTNDCRFPVRGETQGSVTALRTELGYKGVVIWGQPNKGMFAGCEHPANSPYEYGVWAHSGWSDSLLPNVGADERGYLVTGMAANNGINRCVLAELPVKPPVSLLALRHLQVRSQNPFPPFKTEILGNSHASPLIAPDAVFIPNPLMPNPDPNGMQYDDSYCMNWLFADRYFFSSVTPETNDWASSSKRNLEEVYRRHLTEEQKLPNTQYRPIRAAKASEADAIVQRDLNNPTAWQTMASRFVVDGMFNINSTSVEAWKALLEHARDQEVVNFAPQGTDATLQTSQGRGHPVSQTNVAGNECADGPLAAYDKFSGFRRLTDEQMTALAEAIVKQIKRRGPALSLAEFYNRQLRSASGSDSDLALAGVVQAALDELAALSPGDTKNPYSELQALSRKIGPADVPNDANYRYPKAAEGWTGEGLPGWIDQADILSSLAPVLSARDDTFTIRSYGESRDTSGRVLARAWCEATVARVASYVIPDRKLEEGDDANLTTGEFAAMNRKFGRRFVVRSFRWLSPNEV